MNIKYIEQVTKIQYVKLNNGIEMPMLGFGVFQIHDALHILIIRFYNFAIYF
ncbi:hypothetical protein CNEO4_290017 [Clostridium neonatale]|nr:conserved hypothetical protein [Clostridium neonatale]CAI3535272.1 hypothetical protein CNEO3_100114 [Clostridium neonatale]CAI3580505.1 hypothetical protein CNEO4_160112 [Clostridium neonatale]CAI3603338.1 hypothetical protein CNEO4_290017 [Clostridium neonatale]